MREGGMRSSGGFVAGNMPVAKYSEQTSRLNTRADIGLYKDIALIIRLPVILSNDRKLEGYDGSDTNQRIAAQGAPGEQLFSIPFQSPTRSGIEYLAIGMDFDIDSVRARLEAALRPFSEPVALADAHRLRHYRRRNL